MAELFRGGALGCPTRRPIAWLPLVLPPMLPATFALPALLPHLPGAAVALSCVIGAVNAVGEELLWRGTYVAVVGGRRRPAVSYPTLGFALWHLAPQLVRPSHYRSGAWSFVVVAGLVGLGYARVVAATRSIRATSASHALFD